MLADCHTWTTALGVSVPRNRAGHSLSFPTPASAEDLRTQLRAFKRRGFTSYKLFVEPWWPDRLDQASRLLSVAREEAGPGGTVLVDGALAYRDRDTAHKLATVFSEQGVDVFEAPLPLDDVVGHYELREHGVAIGLGDLGLTHWHEWEAFIALASPDVLQPDPSVVGGVTGMRRVAALAHAEGLALFPHGYKTRITMAAGLQVLACQPGEVMIEYCLSPSPLVDGLTSGIGVDGDGYVHVPAGPGLGVDVDRSALERFARPWMVP